MDETGCQVEDVPPCDPTLGGLVLLDSSHIATLSSKCVPDLFFRSCKCRDICWALRLKTKMKRFWRRPEPITPSKAQQTESEPTIDEIDEPWKPSGRPAGHDDSLGALHLPTAPARDVIATVHSAIDWLDANLLAVRVGAAVVAAGGHRGQVD